MVVETNHRASLTRFAWLSIGAAVLTMGLKAAAFWLTGSVGLLSDALESLVNLAGALMALIMLTIAARPADEEHPFGHSKAEYFSSGVEGTLILIAAVTIAIAAIQRLITPRPLEQIGLGIAVSMVAALINLLVSLVLLRAGKRHNSITLEANAQHLMTDVWTSAGVLIGIGLVGVTGWLQLDPLVALVVAGNIIWSGYHLVSRSVKGLMDSALPAEEQNKIETILSPYRESGIRFHEKRTRLAGAQRFVSLHVLVPGKWTVHRGHQLVEKIESDIRQALSNSTVYTHLESLDDPASWDEVLSNHPEATKKEPH